MFDGPDQNRRRFLAARRFKPKGRSANACGERRTGESTKRNVDGERDVAASAIRKSRHRASVSGHHPTLSPPGVA